MAHGKRSLPDPTTESSGTPSTFRRRLSPAGGSYEDQTGDVPCTTCNPPSFLLLSFIRYFSICVSGSTSTTSTPSSVAIGIDHPDVRFEIVYSVSRQFRQLMIIRMPKRLGYVPRSSMATKAGNSCAKNNCLSRRAWQWQPRFGLGSSCAPQ
jgi:hypothetical protein